MEERIKSSIKEVKEDVKKEMQEVKTKLAKEIAEVKTELTKTKDEFDFKIKEASKPGERSGMMTTENYLCFRGIEEQEDEVIRDRMVEILAEHLQQEPERVEERWIWLIELDLHMLKGKIFQGML